MRENTTTPKLMGSTITKPREKTKPHRKALKVSRITAAGQGQPTFTPSGALHMITGQCWWCHYGLCAIEFLKVKRAYSIYFKRECGFKTLQAVLNMTSSAYFKLSKQMSPQLTLCPAAPGSWEQCVTSLSCL